MKSVQQLQQYVDGLNLDQTIEKLGSVVLDWPEYVARQETIMRGREATELRRRLRDNPGDLLLAEAKGWLHQAVTAWPDEASRWLEP